MKQSHLPKIGDAVVRHHAYYRVADVSRDGVLAKIESRCDINLWDIIYTSQLAYDEIHLHWNFTGVMA